MTTIDFPEDQTKPIMEREREAAALEFVLQVVRRDPDHDPKAPIGTSLRRLAEQGDDDAAGILETVNSPRAQISRALMPHAVAADPYWIDNGDGTYSRRDGARLQTPDELVVAFMATTPNDELARLIPENLIKRELALQLLEDLVRKECEAGVARGELVRDTEDGEPVYRVPEGETDE